jgi:hypothetical protein
MKARDLSVVIVIATLSCAAVAAAQEPDPGDEREAAPAGEEPPPESGAPPGDAPPVEAAPAPAAASPDADTTFGSVGQIAISDDLEMVATRVSIEGQSGSQTVIALKPALDFFPIPNLSIGGQLIIGYVSSGSISSTELGLLVRVGYNVPISDAVSIWPRLSIGYDHKSADQYGLSLDSVPIDIFVPIVVQLASHFFIGGGPWYRTTLLSQRESFDEPRVSILGLRATVGGYFRGL